MWKDADVLEKMTLKENGTIFVLYAMTVFVATTCFLVEWGCCQMLTLTWKLPSSFKVHFTLF